MLLPLLDSKLQSSDSHVAEITEGFTLSFRQAFMKAFVQC